MKLDAPCTVVRTGLAEISAYAPHGETHMRRGSIVTALGLFAIILFWSNNLRAQGPAASCSCDAKAGILVIRYTPDLSQASPQWPKQPPPVLFMSLLDLDGDQTTVEGTRSKTISCRLKSARFEVKLEPGVPNINLLGRCGGAVTGVVTVKRNGAVVLNEQEFEGMNCHERKRMLERITFRDGSPKPDLTYVPYPEE